MTQIYRKAQGTRGELRTALWWMVAAMILLTVSRKAEAQSGLLDAFNPLGNSRDGLHLYSVSGFSGWESTVMPQGGFAFPSASNLGADANIGGSASLGWAPRTGGFSVGYSATYMGRIRYSDLSALNHSLTLGLGRGRRLSPKWNLGFSGSAAITNSDQLLFTPTIFSGVVAAPGSFDDLAAAILAGKYNNDQLASLLTGAPMIQTPARTALYGYRVFGSSLSTSLSYAHSQRLSIGFSSSMSYMRNLKDTLSGQHSVYLIPSGVMGGGGVNVSYAVTPRTQVGVSLAVNRLFSGFAQGHATSASASWFVGRTMGRRWFAQAHAGGGYLKYFGSRYAGRSGTAPIFGGSLGHKIYAQTFIASYDRTLDQSYGVGAAHMTSISAAWNWRRPGRSWGLNSSYVLEQLSGTAFGNVDGWRASLGLMRRMGDHMMFGTSYAYGSYNMGGSQSAYNRNQSAVQVSVTWLPAGERR